MGIEEQAAVASSSGRRIPAVDSAEEIRVRRRTLEAVLEQCHRALELLQKSEVDGDLAEEDVEGEKESNSLDSPSAIDDEADELSFPNRTKNNFRQQFSLSAASSVSTAGPNRALVEYLCKSYICSEFSFTEKLLCNLVKCRVESPAFLEKLGSIHMSVCPDVSDDSASWDMVASKDLWDEKPILVDNESDEDSYVLVRQEEIVDGIACFMAAYLLSLKDSKELTPNQLQEALCKTFSAKKKKSRFQKAWDGSKFIYNVASWSATAIGIYQNPALLRAASVVFSTSCRAISKLL